MTRPILICLFAALCTLGANAETLTVTLQRGLESYDGVEDTFLYAPSSVANINYGKHQALNAGINRWKEHYVSLIRFDLSAFPREADVVAASLWLYDASKEWPKRDLVMDIQAISPANREWSEGPGVGVREPVEGTVCWNFRQYDKAKWAGQPGLRKAEVDYLMPPLASVEVKAGHEGWVEFPLHTEVVQAWLGLPGTNAGMRAFPLGAREAGDVMYFPSSDVVAEASRRPKLVLQLEMTDKIAEDFRHARARRAVEATQKLLKQMQEELEQAGSPARGVSALGDLERELTPHQSKAQTYPFRSEARLGEFFAEVGALEQRLKDFPSTLLVVRAAAANEERNLRTDFALGVADSMTNILRKPHWREVAFPEHAEIELARNEFEAAQVIIVPIDRAASGATWSVSDLRGPAGATIPQQDISVAVMGYQKNHKPAIRTIVEWWPGPILDFMESVDVPEGEAQPLWVCVRTRESTPPGVYRGELAVDADRAEAKTIGLRVRVYDFAVPKEQHLLTVWGNNEPTFKGMYGEKYDETMARAMFDFLIEHRLAVNSLYSAQVAGEPVADGWFTDVIGYPTLSDPAELKRLWEAGSRWWNLGYLHPVHARSAKMDWDAYVPRFIEMMRASLKVADAAGWPHSNLGIYFFDETKEFEKLNKAASQVKAAFPDIALMTTGYDRSYGVKDGPIDQSIDIWCPLTPRFAQDNEIIEQGRELGKKAWWYVCCGPRGPRDLNFFTQYPAIRSRLLMGAATWKHQPDGFLYYRISGWRHYKEPISSGPYTDWTPYHLPGPDGDGELFCPGPDGALTTLQFENLRDGIEDFEYYWVLRDLVEKARERGIDVSAEETLLTLPEGFLTSLTSYSEDPARLRAERRKLAEAIVRLQERGR